MEETEATVAAVAVFGLFKEEVMRSSISRRTALAGVLTFLLAGSTSAGESSVTTITVPNMHCMGCAKKVAAKLGAVANVASVSSDMKTKTVTVTPANAKSVSPRALWEAVEASGKTPTKLVGPTGAFDSKPQS